MLKYNVAYDKPEGGFIYCQSWMDHPTAVAMLAKFKARYTNEDGTPKPFPNGKGVYQVSNIRIVTKG
jgi:hypothetical protein